MMKDFNQLADSKTVEKVAKALASHNFDVIVTQNAEEAKEKALSLIPKKSEVFTATSKTLEALGIPEVINNSGNYISVRDELMKMDRQTQSRQMQKLGTAPDYVVGSVHAITEDGKVLVASATGSQLPAYTYGAAHVIWVVSTKKIVKDIDKGMQRIYDFLLPQEDKRLKEQYGPNVSSHVNKIAIFNAEFIPHRITIIFVKENVGF